MMPDALRSEEVRDIAVNWFMAAAEGNLYQSYAKLGQLYSVGAYDRFAVTSFVMTRRHCHIICRGPCVATGNAWKERVLLSFMDLVRKLM